MITRRSSARARRVGVRTTIVAMAAVLGIGLSGCVSFFLPASGKATSTPAPASVSADLAPFYSQKLVWTPCAKTMQCTKASAPLDWSDPSQGKISLALIRQTATGHRLGSLLVNQGGPGASGVAFVRDSVDFAVDKKLQASYDIVGWDPRGVGESSAVKCYDAAGMNKYLYSITPGAVGSDGWLAATTTEAKNFADACQKNSGSLLAHVDSASDAHDMDLIRALLGDKKLNYLGYSYGTYLGTLYADLYPQNTGRLVLDGALDPASTSAEVNQAQTVGFENELRAYLKHCLAHSKCPFTGTVQDGMNTVAALLADVAKSPIRNQDGRELGASTLLTAIIYPLYTPGDWTYLSATFADVMNGSAKDAFILADAYNHRSSDGTFSDNSTEAFTAVNCLDYPAVTDLNTMRAEAAELVKVAPVIGPYMGYGDISCAQWPYKSTVVRGPIHAAGAPPIIVVGTTGDPATPYQWAQNLSKELDSGHLVTYHGEGHTAYNKSNSCVNDAVDNFFVKGTVPATDPQC